MPGLFPLTDQWVCRGQGPVTKDRVFLADSVDSTQVVVFCSCVVRWECVVCVNTSCRGTWRGS